jgi:hypothetical protein
MTYGDYLEKVAESSIPDDLEFPGTFVCTWENGDKSIVTANSKSSLFDVLDEVGDPGGGTFKRIERSAIHFRKVGQNEFKFEGLCEDTEDEIPTYQEGDEDG